MPDPVTHSEVMAAENIDALFCGHVDLGPLRSTGSWEEELMCPACLTTVALAVVGATSTGGLSAFLARTLPRKGPRPADDGADQGPRVESAQGD